MFYETVKCNRKDERIYSSNTLLENILNQDRTDKWVQFYNKPA